MKTILVECRFVIEVPWDDTKPEYATDDHIKFCIEDNGCPGTGSVELAISELMEISEKSSVCWACTVGGTNKILAIEDREPRDYVKEISFVETKSAGKCGGCGALVEILHRENASNEESSYTCKCGANVHHYEMRINGTST